MAPRGLIRLNSTESSKNNANPLGLFHTQQPDRLGSAALRNGSRNLLHMNGVLDVKFHRMDRRHHHEYNPAHSRPKVPVGNLLCLVRSDYRPHNGQRPFHGHCAAESCPFALRQGVHDLHRTATLYIEGFPLHRVIPKP